MIKKFYTPAEVATIIPLQEKGVSYEEIGKQIGRTPIAISNLLSDYRYWKRTGKVYSSRGKNMAQMFADATKLMSPSQPQAQPAGTPDYFSSFDGLMEEFKAKLANVVVDMAKQVVKQEREIIYKEGFAAGKASQQSLGDILKNKFGTKEG